MDNNIDQFRNKFFVQAMNSENSKWENSIKRQVNLEVRIDDIRSEFARDYTRLLHSLGYRRLKHKTQVFFSPENDHICTRIEHVNHVESVSYTIANFLGLNTELTKAISIGHDIGHAPFGHLGETILTEISEKELGVKFWHEKNGLHFVDDVETLVNSQNQYSNLNLTYAVRDGIISHCGEVDQNGIFPREEPIDLSEYISANLYSPYTWEGCIVKYADKISYLGRDIEDAIKLKLIEIADTKPLQVEARKTFKLDIMFINNTSLMHLFIVDLCKNSSIDKGICFSEPVFQFMNKVKKFNYNKIYLHPRLQVYKKIANDIIETIYNLLLQGYDEFNIINKLDDMKKIYPEVFSEFIDWIIPRCDLVNVNKRNKLKIAYHISCGKSEYIKAVIDYIAGMTDNYSKHIYDNIRAFK